MVSTYCILSDLTVQLLSPSSSLSPKVCGFLEVLHSTTWYLETSVWDFRKVASINYRLNEAVPNKSYTALCTFASSGFFKLWHWHWHQPQPPGGRAAVSPNLIALVCILPQFNYHTNKDTVTE
jgi:hypothetical protein